MTYFSMSKQAQAARQPGSVVGRMENYRIEYDAASGIIRSSQRGFWDPSVVDSYFADLRVSVKKMRASKGRVKILSDRREYTVQSSDTINKKLQHMSGMLREGDKVGLIVGSRLLKMQLERAYPKEYFEIFTTQADAETWIVAA